MGYTLNTERDIREMLAVIGVSSIDDLFSDIPEEIQFGGSLSLPPALSEMELDAMIRKAAGRNIRNVSFLGAGAYRHYIPAAVDQLASRSEFYTAYTPYQPEISQGTLTAIFEYQTMICRLTGMDVANASLYDGASSLAEAVLLAVRTNNRRKVIICDSLHPSYREVLATYAWANDLTVETLKNNDGIFEADGSAAVDEATAAVVVQNPNFFGCIEDAAKTAAIAHAHGALLIYVTAEPLSLGLLKKPGDCGADIVCGEAQGFGNPVGFGGPCLGLLAAKESFVRKMPGRLVGKTVDADGKEAYVLTLQTREQHIRRERATSNICTNEGLCALRAVIYLALAGNNLRPLAQLNHDLASYLKTRLSGKGFHPLFSRPFFNEFAVKIPSAEKVITACAERGFSFGVNLGRWYPDYEGCVLLNCTELNTPEQIDELVSIL